MNGIRSVLGGLLGRSLLRSLVLLAALALFLLVLVVIRNTTRESLGARERYRVPFAAIECTPPPGQDRPDFLAEVRYLAELPEQMPGLDEELPRRLAQAFARHPRVETVEQVEIVPPRRVRVRLAYRVPVLVVMRTGTGAEFFRAGVVDRHGIVLPAGAIQEGLPSFFSTRRPAGAAGCAWGDTGVEAAARTAAFLQPYQDQLHLMRFELDGANLVLKTRAGACVSWGRAPGDEGSGEAQAAQKIKQLLGYCRSGGSLDRPSVAMKYDVRSQQNDRP